LEKFDVQQYDYGPNDIFGGVKTMGHPQPAITLAETGSLSVDFAGEYTYPIVKSSQLAPGKHPLIMIMHGDDTPCSDTALAPSPDPTKSWPCPAAYPNPTLSYHGFDALAVRLALQGFVVDSISLDALDSATSGATTDAFDDLLVQHILRWQKSWACPVCVGPDGGDFSGTAGGGTIDFKNIGVLGHSNGAKMALLAPAFVHTKGYSSFSIHAVMALAAPNGTAPVESIAVHGVPVAVVLPYCDDQLPDLGSIRVFDQSSRDAASTTDSAPKYAIMVDGANHTWWNSEYQPSPSPYPHKPGSDWGHGGQYPSDSHCGSPGGSLSPDRLNPALQQQVLVTYAAGFFQMHLDAANTLAWFGFHASKLLPWFTEGDVNVPPSAEPAKVRVTYQPPIAKKDALLVDRFDSYPADALGGTVTSTATVSICGEAASCLPSLPDGSYNTQPDYASANVAQVSTCGTLTEAFPATDVSTYEALQFRGALDVDVTQPSPSPMSVSLSDGTHTVTALVSTYSTVLTQPLGDGPVPAYLSNPVPKAMLQTARLPLSVFKSGGVNLKNVTSIEFSLTCSLLFTENVLLTDVMFAKLTKQ
jgi:hypothetical protein